MARIVLDTNVLVAGLRSRAGSFQVLQLIAKRRVVPVVSVTLLLEYEAVLKRSEQMAAHGYSVQQIEKLLSEFAALAEAVEMHFMWRPQLADSKDEFVLEAAVNASVSALVTYNVRDFAAAAASFGLKVWRPIDFLRRVGNE